VVERALLVGVQAIVLLGVVACGGSPVAGPSGSSTPVSLTPTPRPTKVTAAGAARAKAIADAKTRYLVARTAAEKAMADPATLDRNALTEAGNGEPWLQVLVEEALQLQSYGWYESGHAEISGLRVISVRLGVERPEVRLRACIDSSATAWRFQKTRKLVPTGPGNGKRHEFRSRLVYEPAAAGEVKRWWLIEDKSTGVC
jgi:hypothetical protein